MARLIAWCVLLVGVFAPAAARADLNVTFAPVKDASIFSHTTQNAAGLGSYLMVGRVGPPMSGCDGAGICSSTMRSLIQFNVTSIPAGSDITGVTLRLYQVGSTTVTTARNITIHRIAAASSGSSVWGEAGTPSDVNPGPAIGVASGNGVTWLRRQRLFSSTNWTTPGGNFFITSATLSTSSGGNTTTAILREFSGSGLENDVQAWVNSSGTNLGWMIRGSETTTNTMRRFASKDSSFTCGAGCRPELEVDYELPNGAVCSLNSDCNSNRCVATNNPAVRVCCASTSCSSDGQCFGPGYCQLGTGTCTSDPLSNGTLCSDPNPGNVCSRGECNGAGACVERADPSSSGDVCNASTGPCDPQETCTGASASCPGDVKLTNGTVCPSGADSNPCTLDVCDGVNGACSHPAGNAGVECRAAAPVCDVAELCDGVSTTCPPDVFASSALQCAAASCNTSTDIFQPATFCSGSSSGCPAAPPPTSCAPFVCDPGGLVCSGGCVDDSSCGGGFYCAAPNCVPKKDDGEMCNAPNECTSNQCIDGVCCNTNCGGGNPNDCQSCNGANPGTCSALPQDTVCRAAPGACDIAETCNGVSTACPADVFVRGGTVCRVGECTAGTATVEAVCSGDNPDCPGEQLNDCTPYACNGTVCGTTCTDDMDCLVGNYCDSGSCVPQKVNGIACGAANECVNGFCADGVCCNQDCLGQCEACDVNPGTCEPVIGDPRGSRPQCATDGSICGGQCDGVVTAGCTFPGGATECPRCGMLNRRSDGFCGVRRRGQLSGAPDGHVRSVHVFR